VLCLGDCRLRGNCFFQLADALPGLGARHTLFLDWNKGVGPRQVRRLANVISGLQNLRKVDLLASTNSDSVHAVLRATVPSAEFLFYRHEFYSEGKGRRPAELFFAARFADLRWPGSQHNGRDSSRH
jgi:hypothetical protein